MAVTLRALLGQPSLELQLERAISDAQLDAEIIWAHSSDLPDPTPWLDAGQLLLTDGSQFGDDFLIDDYVARLRSAGVVALGFAEGVVHAEASPLLRRACAQQGLPLVLIPESMPFIRIIRFVADELAAQRHRSVTWSVAAHRAIARATLQPDGLAATLRELEVQLDCWVALYDRLGRRVQLRHGRDVPADLEPVVAEAVDAKLARGRRAAMHIREHGHDLTLQTIGRPGQLLGVLALGTTVPLGPAGNDLVASVIGIASIAIEQSRALDASRHQLRRGVFELLMSGATGAAVRVLHELGSWAPQGSVRVAAMRGAMPPESALGELELRAADAQLAFARFEDELVLYWSANEQTDALVRDEVFAAVGAEALAVGVSAAVDLDAFAEGVRQARNAAARARSGRPLEYGQLADQGMLAWLEAADGAVAARRLLEPVWQRSDAQVLLRSARVWFTHNCAWDPAARELGIHRHTLRHRIDQLGEVCGLELDNFSARAELFTALQLAA